MGMPAEQVEETVAPLRACPHCGALEHRPLPACSRDGWAVVECASCGFVYLSNPPGDDALEEEFAWEKTIDQEAVARKKRAPILYGLDYATRRWRAVLKPDENRGYRRWFGDNARVLDVGCGHGGRLAPPLIPFGIELSRVLHAEADAAMRARGGYCVHGPGAEAIWAFPEDHFDGIVMRSYLEHESSPRRVLDGAARALKPGGAVYVKVPNYASLNRKVIGSNWCGFRHPDHVNYFTPSSLAAMAAKSGFAMTILNRWNLALDDNIHALLRPA
ncbi:MAG: class I SAM-dependent methyltransferase [Pseudomonadota bacterium]